MATVLATDVRRDLLIQGERFRLLVQTTHRDGSVATTLVHRQDFSRRIGGARFVDVGSVEEAAHLAAAMTQKCLAAGLSMDGQKSVISCPGGLPRSYAERARILREHVEIVVQHDPGVIFGPDMGNPEASMDRVAAVPALLDHVTGLSGALRGLSIDHRGYTGLGVAHAVAGLNARLLHRGSAAGVEVPATWGRAGVQRSHAWPSHEEDDRCPAGAEALARRRSAPGPGETGGHGLRTFTVQGWGAVGAWSALLLEGQGLELVGLSTVDGALRAAPGERLVARDLHAAWQDDPAGVMAAGARSGGEALDRDALLDVPCDVFIPAARTQVLALREELSAVRRENPHARSVEDFLERTGVRVVAEGANHPLSDGAERYLEDHGVVVLPDIVVNCGGLIGCAMEWEARRSGSVDLGQLDRDARGRITRTVQTNVETLGAFGGHVRDGVARLLSARGSQETVPVG